MKTYLFKDEISSIKATAIFLRLTIRDFWFHKQETAKNGELNTLFYIWPNYIKWLRAIIIDPTNRKMYITLRLKNI